jgi:hypothetical protein
MSLPQFDLTNILSTSLLTYVFIFLCYFFMKNTIISYIKNLYEVSEIEIENIKNDNNSIKEEETLLEKEIKSISSYLKDTYEKDKIIILENYSNNIYGIDQKLKNIYKEKELDFQKDLEKKYEEDNIKEILKKIKYNIIEENRKES